MPNVMAIGSGLISGRTNTTNEFTVYTNRSGYHGLSVGIDGPSRAEIKYTDNHDGTIKVSYIPSIPGEYMITIKFDGINLSGSPYKVRIRGDEPFNYSSSRSTGYEGFGSSSSGFSSPARARVTGRGLYSGITNVQNEIVVDVKNCGSGRLHWSIEGPGNVETKNRGVENGVYKLYYKPDTPGNYNIKIKYDERDVPGSPFNVRIV
ncbi:filamin-C isoform X2 [Tetranychus urticae]|uniref:Uncharacterized protein n=1 Tax=Tetranychus urticae TaxID=32264 RepID=T1K253_TETUR|nr:filamin-C isoform X2 [Tetranychus urticae]